MTEDGADNIRALPPLPKLTLKRGYGTARNADGSWCRHSAVEVDDELAEVSCVSCGAKLNPMAVLRKLAHEESVLPERIDQLSIETDALARKSKTVCVHCGGITKVLPTDAALREVRRERHEARMNRPKEDK